MNTVTVRQRGEITLPKVVRDTCHVGPGTTFSVVPVGDVIVLIKGSSPVSEAVAQLEHLREAAGLTTEQMLEGLDEERERYYREHYGH
jgi:bifunctional DNA-binding transcriptional regulator/antitoxin component of YhaV-PrlF toxin-antitoxin module